MTFSQSDTVPNHAPIRSNFHAVRASILNVEVCPITMDDAVSTVEKWIAERTPNYVCITGVHGVIESQSNLRLRAIHNNAGMVTPDGMPLVWMCRALGYRNTSRVYGPDLMRALSAISARRGYRQFYYGGNDGVADLLKEKLEARHPGLQVVGTYAPPFRPLTPEEDDAVVQRINAEKPDIVWVGLSTPKQEYWMAEHLHRIDAPVMIGVGAAFDFLSDSQAASAPGDAAEWARMALSPGDQPRRLWRRYFNIVPRFLGARYRAVGDDLGAPAGIGRGQERVENKFRRRQMITPLLPWFRFARAVVLGGSGHPSILRWRAAH